MGEHSIPNDETVNDTSNADTDNTTVTEDADVPEKAEAPVIDGPPANPDGETRAETGYDRL